MALMDTLQNIGTGARNFLIGSPGSTEFSPRLNPQQQQLQSLAGSQASSLIQNLGQRKFNFEPIAQQARTNFQTKTIPSIANRFAALGAQGSGAYQHALGSAGAGLEEGLAALQAKYDFAQGGQDQQLLLSLLAQALQPQQDNMYYPGQPGLLQALLPALTQGTSSGISSLLKLIGLG